MSRRFLFFIVELKQTKIDFADKNGNYFRRRLPFFTNRVTINNIHLFPSRSSCHKIFAAGTESNVHAFQILNPGKQLISIGYSGNRTGFFFIKGGKTGEGGGKRGKSEWWLSYSEYKLSQDMDIRKKLWQEEAGGGIPRAARSCTVKLSGKTKQQEKKTTLTCLSRNSSKFSLCIPRSSQHTPDLVHRSFTSSSPFSTARHCDNSLAIRTAARPDSTYTIIINYLPSLQTTL